MKTNSGQTIIASIIEANHVTKTGVSYVLCEDDTGHCAAYMREMNLASMGFPADFAYITEARGHKMTYNKAKKIFDAFVTETNYRR